MQDSLEVPNNLTVEEAQQAINTASALKSGVNTVVTGAEKIAHGVTSMLQGSKKVVVSAARSVTGK